MKKYILAILLTGIGAICFSNNISITNTTIASRNTVAGYAMIQFDLSWDNSWRTSSGPSNWDAAWIFIKYRIKGQTAWHHASLNWTDGTGSGDGHSVPTGAVIKGDIDTSDGNSLGVFIYASANKSQSSANYPAVQLRWDYKDDAVQNSDLVEICVFGIEMVYVPQGSFKAGKLFGIYNSFYTWPDDQSDYTISSESAITVSASNGMLFYDGSGDQQNIPSTFPKGYNGIYCMKYEITQEQYVEFLLKLTASQTGLRAYTGGGARNEITGGFGTYTTGNPYVACNFLSWGDLAAYLDWAALRPMTELEYEKACRGTLPAVQEEFAWGTTTRASLTYTLHNDGADDESILTNYNINTGNANYTTTNGSIDGPLRVGIFSSHVSNTGRVTAGATYYGIMEMTGNLFEQTVTVGNNTGRQFTGAHGDGSLTANGDHNAANWPGVDAVGSGQKGGGWHTSLAPPNPLFVSSRVSATTGVTTRDDDKGGRGVRTAP